MLSSTSAYGKKRDRDHAIDYLTPKGGLVSRFIVMGDTGGNDVGNCTDDDVFFEIEFNPISVEGERKSGS